MDTTCQRCSGWLNREEDKWGMHITCVNCGWEKAVWTVSEQEAQHLMQQDEEAGRRTGYGAKNVRIMPRGLKAGNKGNMAVDPTEKEIIENLSIILSGNLKNKATI